MKANNAPIKFSFIHVRGLDLYMPLSLFVALIFLPSHFKRIYCGACSVIGTTVVIMENLF